MRSELIDGYPAADERDQIGRFLQHAFPLDPAPFTELLDKLTDKQSPKELARH